jgi:uncharacterized protein
MTFDWTQGELAEGLRLYNAAEYFVAHEAWESVWLTAPEPEKAFLQGLIQVTAAFHHFQRGNFIGARRTFEKALRRLDPLPAGFGGIAVAQLRDDIRDRLQNLDQPPTQLAPARIEPLCL